MDFYGKHYITPIYTNLNIFIDDLEEVLHQLDSIAASNQVINAYIALSDGNTYSTSTSGLVPNFNAKEKYSDYCIADDSI